MHTYLVLHAYDIIYFIYRNIYNNNAWFFPNKRLMGRDDCTLYIIIIIYDSRIRWRRRQLYEDDHDVWVYNATSTTCTRSPAFIIYTTVVIIFFFVRPLAHTHETLWFRKKNKTIARRKFGGFFPRLYKTPNKDVNGNTYAHTHTLRTQWQRRCAL